VLNYDIPYDTESYIHRIGRTGRAGRSGEAILFVTPRERGMLHAIERATRQPIEQMQLPTVEAVNDLRINKFKQRISDTLAVGSLELFQKLVEQYESEHDVPALEIAAALARIAQGDRPLLLAPPAKHETAMRPAAAGSARERPVRERADNLRAEPAGQAAGDSVRPRTGVKVHEARQRPLRPHATEAGKRTYRIEVGHDHGVKPGNIVGAIANESGLDSQYIGRLSIRGQYSLIDLPEGMPAEIFEHLRKVWVMQQQLRIREWNGEAGPEDAGEPPTPRQPPAPRAGKPQPPVRKPRASGFKPPRRK